MKLVSLLVLLTIQVALQAPAYQLHAEMALPRTTVSTYPPQDNISFYYTNNHGVTIYIRRLQSGFFPPQGCGPVDLAEFLAGYTVMSVRLPWSIGYDKLFMDTGNNPHGSIVSLEPDYIPLQPGQSISIDISPYYTGLQFVQVELVIWWTFEQ